MALRRSKIRIDIVGPRPNEVDIDELVAILGELRTAITACTPQKVPSDPFFPDLRVSLVAIVKGSDGLVLEIGPVAANGIAKISRSLRRREYDELPRSAHEALYRINQFTARRKWGIRFRRNERLEIEPVEVLAADHVSSPLTRATISGRTMLLARCLRVGGATKPKGELRLSDGSLLYVDVTETVARELGKRLYDEVVLSGDAVWDARSGELREFRVVEVSTFRAIPPTIAFKELAEAARGRWDNVDADSYVRQIRESSE